MLYLCQYYLLFLYNQNIANKYLVKEAMYFPYKKKFLNLISNYYICEQIYRSLISFYNLL